ncbi:MAG: hypothetical protein ACRC1P_01745 [Cellulosilyticaceae bacterium]
MKKFLIILCSFILIGIFIKIEDIHFNKMGAVYTILPQLAKEDIEVLETIELLDNREWIAYRSKDKSEYGSILIKKSLGLFYHAESAVTLQLSNQTPLVRSKPSMYGKEMIFVATHDAEIAYLSSGIENPNFSQETIQSLTLADVLAKPDTYTVEAIKDGYALFIWDESITPEESNLNNYILAFDNAGNLIIDATGTLYGIYVK